MGFNKSPFFIRRLLYIEEKMKASYRSSFARVISLALVFVLVLGAMTVVGVKVANAEVSTFVDSDGANDEPGQKDITRLTRDQSSIDPVIITWNWDIISLSGSNTADGCALFDRMVTCSPISRYARAGMGRRNPQTDIPFFIPATIPGLIAALEAWL